MVMTPERFYRLKYERSQRELERTKSAVDDFGVDIFSMGGETITISKAMKIEAVYTCIRDKAETVGRLPVHLYDNSNPDAVRRVRDNRLHRIFTERPCDFMTMQGFMEFMTASYELYGAFYAYPVYNDRGGIMEIVPIRYQQNIVPSMDVNGNVYFRYVTNDGKPHLVFGIDELFIVGQFTLDGITPVSPIQYNAQLLNGTYETEDPGNHFKRKASLHSLRSRRTRLLMRKRHSG